MRRRSRLPVGITATTVLCLIALASALAPVAMVDDADQTPPIAALADWRPQFGDCVRDSRDDLMQSNYLTVGCKQSHAFEVFLVGDHTGEIATAETPPDEGSPEFREIWRACDTELDEYFGGPWRNRNLRLWVEHPVPQSWKLGARWYACTVMPAEGDTLDEHVRKGYRFSTSLDISCYQVAPSGDAEKTSCGEPHNAEFVDYFLAEQSTWKQMRADLDKERRGRGHQKCRQMVAKQAPHLGAALGSWLWPPSETEWAAGDRTIRCFVWTSLLPIGFKLIPRQV